MRTVIITLLACLSLAGQITQVPPPAGGGGGATGATGATGPAGAAGAGNNTFCADATGSTTTYTCPSPTPAITTLTGLIVSFKPQTTNTGTSTLNVAGLGAKTLKQSDGSTNVASGALVGGTTYAFAYDGTNLVQTGSGGAGGGVSSVATGCGLSGGPITTTGTVSAAEAVNSQTGAGSYAIVTGDCGKLIARSNAAYVSDTIAQAGTTGFAAGSYWDYYCIGAGGCKITPATSTIAGAAFIALVSGQGLRIISDGTNYKTVGVMQGFPTIVTSEQYGAVGNGTTDDTTAIQAAIAAVSTGTGGVVMFGSRRYLTSAALTITASGVRLKGVGRTTGTAVSTEILNNQTTGNIITVSGGISQVSIEGMTLARSVTTTAGYGISTTGGSEYLYRDLAIIDSFHGFLLNGVGDPTIENAIVIYNSSSVNPRFGFEVDATTTGSFTAYFRYCQVVTGSSANGANVKGFYSHGAHSTDLQLDNPEAALIDYGIYFDFANGGGTDIRIINPIMDQISVAGISILKNGTMPGASVNIIGGQILTIAASATAALFDTTVGVLLSGMKVWCNTPTGTTGISVINGSSANNTFIGSKINGCGTGISISAGISNVVNSSQVTNATTGLLLTGGANSNLIESNIFAPSVTTSLSADSTGFNKIIGNYLYPTISNTGPNTFVGNTDASNMIPSLNVASCTGATLGSGSTNEAGTITGVPTGTCTIVMTFQNEPAPTGYNCTVADVTSGVYLMQTATGNTTTACRFTGTTTLGDTLRYTRSRPF